MNAVRQFSLRSRVLLLTGLLFLVFAVPVWLAVRSMADHLVEDWASRFAQLQVQHDKSRTLAPLLREVSLAQELTTSAAVLAWARDPSREPAASEGLRELERYRERFHDRTYFAALLANGHYYFNNADNEFGERAFRYVLNRSKASDAWFFQQIDRGRTVLVNVNPDDNLGLTKVWINVLIRDGTKVLGMAGTGMDLDWFLNKVVETRQPGVMNLFLNADGAVQLSRDRDMIDFGSIAKSGSDHKTIDQLLNASDAGNVLQAMRALRSEPEGIRTLAVEVGGRPHLAGIAYLPEIDWYDLTLLDLDVVLPASTFGGILAVYLVAMAALLMVFNVMIRRFVLNPVEALDRAMQSVEAGHEDVPALQYPSGGELRRLMMRFTQMTQAVLDLRRGLEAKVQERTQALESLLRTDTLTGILNRRGMEERLSTELQRNARSGRTAGLICLDVDDFKTINDVHGHGVGDVALKAVAETLTRTLRPYDAAARWGGDEFLVLVAECDAVTLERLGHRICQAVSSNHGVRDAQGQLLDLQVSAGGHLVPAGESQEPALQAADQALYVSKANGKGRYSTYVPAGTGSDKR